jgi:hypothetical protein
MATDFFYYIWHSEQPARRRKMKKINSVSSDLVVDNEHHAFSPSQSADRAHVNFLDKWFLQRSLALLGNPAISVVLWNNEEITSSQAQPIARLLVRDRKSLYQLLRNPAAAAQSGCTLWRSL